MSQLAPIGELVSDGLDGSCSPPGNVGAALDLARRFGPIWPQTPQKTGYQGTNGAKDATRDDAMICRMWTEHPDAVPALITGEPSGIVALDIDIKGGRHGIDTLEEMGVAFHPITPTAHTPSGGLHVLFRRPGHPVPSTTDKIGRGLEVKGDGGWITLPPGPGRAWDAHLGPLTPLAELPRWAILPESAPAPARSRPVPLGGLTRYGEAALDAAVASITNAAAGAQELTLNKESFSIGQLVAGAVIPAPLALDSLRWAARRMPSFDAHRPWRAGEVERKVKDAFTAGLRVPRTVPHG